MNRMMRTITGILKAQVRRHAEGSDLTDAEIDACMQRSIPATIGHTCEACATGKWVPPPDKSRQALRAARRAEAAASAARPRSLPQKTSKKK